MKKTASLLAALFFLLPFTFAQVSTAFNQPFPQFQLGIYDLFLDCLPDNAHTQAAKVKSLSVSESVLNDERRKYEKEFELYEVKYDEQGRFILEEELYDPEVDHEYSGPIQTRCQYDSQGRIIQWRYTVGEFVGETDTFFYQANQKLQQICNFSRVGTNNISLTDCKVFQFDASGRLQTLTEQDCDKPGKNGEPFCSGPEPKIRYYFTWNSSGQVEKVAVKEVFMDYVYDESIEDSRLKETGTELVEIYFYTYNQKGQLTSFAIREPDQGLRESLNLTWDTHGNLILAEASFLNGDIRQVKIEWNEKNLPEVVYFGEPGDQSEPVYNYKRVYSYKYW